MQNECFSSDFIDIMQALDSFSYLISLVVRYQVCEAQSAPEEPSVKTPFPFLLLPQGCLGDLLLMLCVTGLNHEMFAAGSSSYLYSLIVLFFPLGKKKVSFVPSQCGHVNKYRTFVSGG